MPERAIKSHVPVCDEQSQTVDISLSAGTYFCLSCMNDTVTTVLCIHHRTDDDDALSIVIVQILKMSRYKRLVPNLVAQLKIVLLAVQHELQPPAVKDVCFVNATKSPQHGPAVCRLLPWWFRWCSTTTSGTKPEDGLLEVNGRNDF